VGSRAGEKDLRASENKGGGPVKQTPLWKRGHTKQVGPQPGVFENSFRLLGKVREGHKNENPEPV